MYLSLVVDAFYRLQSTYAKACLFICQKARKKDDAKWKLLPPDLGVINYPQYRTSTQTIVGITRDSIVEYDPISRKVNELTTGLPRGG